MAKTVVMKPTSQIKARLGIQPNGPVQKFFTNECYRYMDKYVPYREGGLSKTVAFDTKGGSITYLSPYAHYMYEGKVYGPNIPFEDEEGNIYWRSFKERTKTDTGREIKYNQTAGHEYAGPHWDKRMVSAEMDDLIKEVQDYIDRGGK